MQVHLQANSDAWACVVGGRGKVADEQEDGAPSFVDRGSDSIDGLVVDASQYVEWEPAAESDAVVAAGVAVAAAAETTAAAGLLLRTGP